MTCIYINGTMNGLLLTVVLFRACLSAITSKACYGPDGLPCTKHTLECSSGMIAIQDAYYTNSTACNSTGLSSCNINVSSIPDTGRYLDLNETQLNNLYKKCSAQQRCTFNGDRRKAFIHFSIVKFICITDSDNLCGHVNAKTSDAFLLWTRNKSSTDDQTCTCTISTLQSNTKLSVTVLDMRFNNTRQLCPGITISVGGNNLPVHCSQLSPYHLLVNTSQQVQVTVNSGEDGLKGIVWIRIQGSNTVRLICNEKSTSTTDVVSTTLPSSNSITSSSMTDYIPTVKSTTATETGYTSNLTSNVHSTSTILPTLTTRGSGTNVTDFLQTNTQESSNIETIVGIVIPCLLIIIAMVLIAVFIVRRKKAKTVEKNRKTNPKTQGQEVYSLAGLGHQNEYCKVEKGPGKCATVDYGYAGIENISSNSSSKDHKVYSLAGGVHRNEYFEIEPSATQKSSTDYDHACIPNTHASTNSIGENFGTTNKQGKEDDYDHVGEKPMTQNGHYDTTASVAKKLSKLEANDKNNDENVYSYDHLNGITSRENTNNDYNVTGRSSDYDTTASVQKRFEHATECGEDDYGYIHLGNQVQKKTIQNDYHTSASAVTAVARLNSRTDKPDYDHVTKDPGGAPSSYDPGNIEDGSDVKALAKEANNPYQLAK